jgi:hypothetical protein
MNEQYLSIKDAIDKTGMSDASLRRLCRKGLKGRDYKHDLDGRLFLSESFLFNIYPPLNQPIKTHSKDDYSSYQAIQNELGLIKESFLIQTNALSDEKDKRINDLKGELIAKDTMIGNLASAIEGLNKNMSLLTERTREQNIIIQSLQDKFSHQLPNNSASISKHIPNTVMLVDKLLIGVAALASLAVLTFLGMMLFAYFKS